MSIKEREIKAQIKSDGAHATARKLKEALEQGHLAYTEFSSIKMLYDNFVTEKGKDKQSCGHYVLQESELSEDAGNITDTSGFNVITSQIFFNALSTRYSAADFNIAPLFKMIPSNLPQGDTFGGISNLNEAMQVTPEGRTLPSISPTQDYSRSPPMQQRGSIVNVTIQMMRSDATGQILNIFENLGSALGTARELEACSTVLDLGESNPRCRYNWKNVPYQTYGTSGLPWVNEVTGNGLLNYENLQAAWLTQQNILDPYTNLPVLSPPGRAKLLVTPTNQFIAQRLARGIQYRTSTLTLGTDNSPLVISDGTPPVEFDIVSSKYLSNILANNGGAQTTWLLCFPDMAFSFQQMQGMTVSEAIPGTGELFSRNLAASYKTFKIESSYCWNPRYSILNTA